MSSADIVASSFNFSEQFVKISSVEKLCLVNVAQTLFLDSGVGISDLLSQVLSNLDLMYGAMN